MDEAKDRLTGLMPGDNSTPCRAAAGTLAFLLSVVRCKEDLSEAEEQCVRDVIAQLGVEDEALAAEKQARERAEQERDDLQSWLNMKKYLDSEIEKERAQ